MQKFNRLLANYSHVKITEKLITQIIRNNLDTSFNSACTEYNVV